MRDAFDIQVYPKRKRTISVLGIWPYLWKKDLKRIDRRLSMVERRRNCNYRNRYQVSLLLSILDRLALVRSAVSSWQFAGCTLIRFTDGKWRQRGLGNAHGVLDRYWVCVQQVKYDQYERAAGRKSMTMFDSFAPFVSFVRTFVRFRQTVQYL